MDHFTLAACSTSSCLTTRHYDRSITTLSWNNDYVNKIYNDARRTLADRRTGATEAYRSVDICIVGRQIQG